MVKIFIAAEIIIYSIILLVRVVKRHKKDDKFIKVTFENFE